MDDKDVFNFVLDRQDILTEDVAFLQAYKLVIQDKDRSQHQQINAQNGNHTLPLLHDTFIVPWILG